MSDRTKDDSKLDTMIDESFPASDPPSTTPPSATRKSKDLHEAHEGRAGEKGSHAAKGSPTSDRHASETASGRQEGVKPPEHKTR